MSMFLSGILKKGSCRPFLNQEMPQHSHIDMKKEIDCQKTRALGEILPAVIPHLVKTKLTLQKKAAKSARRTPLRDFCFGSSFFMRKTTNPTKIQIVPTTVAVVAFSPRKRIAATLAKKG